MWVRSAVLAAAMLAPAAQAAEPQLFAVEFRTGPRWDTAKAPQDQAGFREHSANLRALREQGRLVMGARYADKGLVVLRAESADEARRWLDADPAVQAGVFAYELNEFRVFYSGFVGAAPKN